MINRAFILRGEAWGHRVKRRLNQPPVGIVPWMQQHTILIKDEPKRMVGYYPMRDVPCFIKLYRRRTPLHLLVYAMRLGQPLRTFRNIIELSANGVPTPRPLSCVLTWQGVLVLTKGVSEGGTYDQLWASRPAREEAHRMMRGAGKTIASAHACGFSHGDCKWSNLLWSQGECYLIDLDSARRSRFRRARRRARDLARFTVAAEEGGVPQELLESFLHSYLEESGDSRDDLIRRMRPNLEKLRNRHEKKYGIVAQPLI